MKALAKLIKDYKADPNFVTWAKTQPDLQTAWAACKRSDWMLWMLDRANVDKYDPRFRSMACEFAQTVGYSKDYNREAFVAIDAAKRAARDVPFVVWDAVKGMEPGVARNAAWVAASDAARAAQADIVRHYFPECPEIVTPPRRGKDRRIHPTPTS
jgi:hypothetical protein